MHSAIPTTVLLAILSSSVPVATRNPTFEERVGAQEAIERVYYAHHIGATLPFEQAVPQEVIEGKVLDALRKSVALEPIWYAPVTAQVLEAEWQRMRRGSRFPERLREIERALGGDRLLLLETLVRSSVVNRLVPRLYEAAPLVAQEDFHAWWRRAATSFGELAAASAAPEVGATTDAPAGCLPFDTRDPGIFAGWPGPRSDLASARTGTEMLIFGGDQPASGEPHTGWRYDPLIDDWSPMAPLDTTALTSAGAHARTGSQWIVWDTLHQVGRRYSPTTDSWTPVTLASLPLSDDAIDLIGTLPPGATGSVTIRVVDTNRTAGNQALDTVTIDELFVRATP